MSLARVRNKKLFPEIIPAKMFETNSSFYAEKHATGKVIV